MRSMPPQMRLKEREEKKKKKNLFKNVCLYLDNTYHIHILKKPIYFVSFLITHITRVYASVHIHAIDSNENRFPPQKNFFFFSKQT